MKGPWGGWLKLRGRRVCEVKEVEWRLTDFFVTVNRNRKCAGTHSCRILIIWSGFLHPISTFSTPNCHNWSQFQILLPSARCVVLFNSGYCPFHLLLKQKIVVRAGPGVRDVRNGMKAWENRGKNRGKSQSQKWWVENEPLRSLIKYVHQNKYFDRCKIS